MKKQRMNGYLHLGLILTCALAALIILGFFWTPYDPQAMSVGPKFDAPSLRHLMGTDNFGRDIFSRVLQGAGTTFAIAVSTVAIGAVLGTLVGALTGYFGGIVDDVLMRLGDVLTAFPSILLALVVISLLRPQTPQGEFLQPDGNEVSPTLPLPAADPAAASEAN